MALGMKAFGQVFLEGTTKCCHYRIGFDSSKINVVSYSVQTNPSEVKLVKGHQGKIFTSMSEVISDIPDRAKLLVGGFASSGVSENILKAINIKGCKELTIVTNNPGPESSIISEMIQAGRVKRLISSFIGENRYCQKQYMSGELEVEFVPQGNLGERIRAGGAGIPGFYTATGFGTIVQEGKVPIKYDKTGKPIILSEPKIVKEFDGRKYVLETAITGDFALIKAWKADKAGNLVFKNAARNFNPVMSKAAKVTIVEAEEIVEIGQLEPDRIHLSGIYVDRIIQGNTPKRKVERTPTRSASVDDSAVRDRIVKRAVLELKDGMYVNLGVGIPNQVADIIPKNINVTVHAENGILGVGPTPPPDQVDQDIINAGKFAASFVPGASVIASDESFVIIRGGHLDVTILGAMQVSQKGDLANWMIPGMMTSGMGGAMDLVSASRTKVIVIMQHTARDGVPKILPTCTIPLTGQQCVDMIITDLAVFEVEKGKGLKLIEIAPGVEVADIVRSTGCDFSVSNDLKEMAGLSIDSQS